MHELSVCQGLLQQLAPISAKNDGEVSEIHLRIGPLSGVEPTLLRSAFSIAQKQSVAPQAKLIIEHSALMVRCGQCETESEVSVNDLRCRQCANQQTQLISGDELLLVSVQFSGEPQHV